MKITEKQIAEIDRNNAKARAIIDSLIHGIEADQEGLDTMAMLEAAFDYLEHNNEIFKAGC